LKIELPKSETAGTKTEFDIKISHSKSFYVIHFAINNRSTKGSTLPYNIADLISQVSEE